MMMMSTANASNLQASFHLFTLRALTEFTTFLLQFDFCASNLPLDRWILSELQDLMGQKVFHLANYVKKKLSVELIILR